MSAQTAQAVFNAYKNVKRAEYRNIPRGMMSANADDVRMVDLKTLLAEVKTAQTLDLEHSGRSVRKAFAQKINALKTKGYQQYWRTQERGEVKLILIKKAGNKVKEIVKLDTDHDECSAVLVTGNIDPDHIGAALELADD